MKLYVAREYVLDFVGGWADEAFAVFTGEQLVGRVVVRENFFGGIEGELRSEGQLVLVEIDFVLLQMRDRSLQCLGVIVERFDFADRGTEIGDGDQILFTEVIRNVAQVADRGRQMAFANVSVEVLHIAFLTSFDEVLEVIAAASELLDDVEVFVVSDAVGVLFLQVRNPCCRRTRRRLCCLLSNRTSGSVLRQPNR